MLAWIMIWLFVIADQLRDAMGNYPGMFMLAFVVTILGGFLTAMVYSESYQSWEAFTAAHAKLLKTGKRVVYSLWFMGFAMWTVHTLLPTQKNLAIMVGSGLTYEMLTSETGQRLGGKAVELLEQKMDEALGSDSEAQNGKKEDKEAKPEKGNSQPSGKVHGQAV